MKKTFKPVQIDDFTVDLGEFKTESAAIVHLSKMKGVQGKQFTILPVLTF